MTERPFRREGIEKLEARFRDAVDDREMLETLAGELEQRTTHRAGLLYDRVRNRLDELAGAPPVEDGPGAGDEAGVEGEVDEPEVMVAAEEVATVAATPLDDAASDPIEVDEDAPVKGALPPEPPADGPRDDPAAILDLWTALEVLSPQTFMRPEDLANGDLSCVARFGDGRSLPWVNGPETSRPRRRLYYQIVLGAIPMEVASAELLKAFGDKRPERPASRGFAALAAITVDKHGRPVEEDAVAVSSFAWGYGLARTGNLQALKNWPTVEAELIEGIDRRIRRVENDELQPLDEERIALVHRWLCAQIALPPDERVETYFAVRVYHWFESPGDPAPMLLNSFFLGDLALASSLHAGNTLGTGLRAYLGMDVPEVPVDLMNERPAVEAALAPARTPRARWPTAGGHSLALLQQAAVNTVFDRLAGSAGIVGINGPPGTGKTTLLRDLVAGVILERAHGLAEFAEPEDAFTHCGRFRRGQGFIHVYELAAKLRGHEVLVASSNNRAVENVSRELPDRNAIAADRAPRYFPSIAQCVAGEGRDAWGMIAGVLGNAANRVALRRDFWVDADNGMRAYLWAAAGNHPTVERTNPETGATETVNAAVIANEDPPRDKADALNRWQQARRSFKRAVLDADAALKDLERVRALIRTHAELVQDRAAIADQVAKATREEFNAQNVATRAALECGAARQAVEAATQATREHRKTRPGVFSRLFRRAPWRVWSAEMTRRTEVHRAAGLARNAADGRHAVAERLLEGIGRALAAARNELGLLDEALHRQEALIAPERQRLGIQLADEAFWASSHDVLQKSTAWLTAETQRLRDQCFAAAMELHRAFIGAAAKPIRNNLNALFGILVGDRLNDVTRPALPSLWSTLFLIVPVLSTTFASVGRMLGPMPPQSIGWLLIDEAGQALPQAAVGAVLRAQRSVVVGDPLQIEPVVTLPLSLVERIALRFSVTPETWTAPRASTQTLADAASPYQSWIEQIEGSVRVGIPLLVHRRCADPMFGISNTIAYGGKMVQAKAPKASRIRDVLGPAGWVHVAGAGSGKWCPAEGEKVVELVRQLVDAGIEDPDIFVITPFRIVAQRMREVLVRSDPLRRIASNPRAWVRDRVGTVHTVQGREAEAVFLVLGAPEARQSGARGWARLSGELSQCGRQPSAGGRLRRGKPRTVEISRQLPRCQRPACPARLKGARPPTISPVPPARGPPLYSAFPASLFPTLSTRRLSAVLGRTHADKFTTGPFSIWPAIFLSISASFVANRTRNE